MNEKTKATENKCSVTVAVGIFLPFNFCLVLSQLRGLPDGGQVIGGNCRNVFGDRIFL